jgi:Ca2+-binding EF-hand superfamily protein
MSGWSLVAGDRRGGLQMQQRSPTPLAAVLLCGVLAFATSAGAGDNQNDFALTDRNKDGAIDRDEYRARMVEVFYFADTNGDGVVVIEELTAREQVDPAAYGDADGNHDGRLTLQEFVTYRMRDFATADRSGDGVLTLEEVETWTTSAPAR